VHSVWQKRPAGLHSSVLTRVCSVVQLHFTDSRSEGICSPTIPLPLPSWKS
jgi:hypothetical protein